MRKRQFLKGVGAAATASTVSLAGCLGLGDDPDLTGLVIGSATPENTAKSNFCDYFAENVEEMSDGEITMQVFYGAELGAAPEQFEAVQGGAQAGYAFGWPTVPVVGGANYIHGIVLPYEYEDYEGRMQDLYYDPPDMIHELNEELAADTNMRFVEGGAGQLGQRVPTANVPLTSPEDFEGLLVRTPEGPMYSAVKSGWGGIPVEMPTEELVTALAADAVDVSMWPAELHFLVGSYEFHDYFHDYRYYQQDTPMFINEDLWQGLTDDQQDIFEEAAYDASIEQIEWLQDVEAEIFDTVEDEGHTVVRHEEIDHEALGEAAMSKVAEDLPDAMAFIEDFRAAT